MRSATYLLAAMITLYSQFSMASSGMVQLKSQYDIELTAKRFMAIAQRNQISIITRIAHHNNASTAGKTLRPTYTILFNSPNIDSALLQCSQLAALDLPQKVLIWEDGRGNIWFNYNSYSYLEKRHELQRCNFPIKKFANSMQQMALEATQKIKVRR
ncbi:MAG: DUF302 domain-containing protein [Vibrionaceae bacterium]